MSQPRQKASRFHAFNRRLLQFALLLATAGLSFAALILPISTRPSYYPIKIGDVAPQDIQAPYALSYISQVLTDQMRDDAEQRVSPVFLPADPAIARQQIELLRTALNFISNVRADTYATSEQKTADLAALQDIQLSRDDVEHILTMSDTRWQSVQQEALVVLEQVMRNTIREGQVKDAQRGIPTLISFTLPQEQALTVASLVTPFVVPNSLYSEDSTAAARKEGRDNVQPVTRVFVSGETIVRRGQIITAAHYEALQQFGLIETPDNFRNILSTASLVTVIFGFVGLYMHKRRMAVMESLRSLGLLAATFLLFLYFARLVIPNRTVIPYLYPLPAFGLTISCLFNVELGLILSLVLSLLAPYGLPNNLDLSMFYIVSSFVGILILGKGLRIGSFFSAGLGVGAAGAVTVIAYHLQDPLSDLTGIATLTVASFLNGIASASLTLILQFLFAQILGLATALQLLEISRPDHPLQQFILQNAPGSYQHSLQVAIMAEQAADRIGADSLLVRVGAIYHDAGKALNPLFYIENQIPGKLNPHDDLDPVVSAQTIIRHVSDGAQLAKKYRMPSRIIDFVREHHGTMITRYQFSRALEANRDEPDKVDVNLFRYPGPRPQSRETALLMLADGCQARARAELPQNEEDLTRLVKKVITFCQQEGQLDDTRLTLRDLNVITEAFVNTLQNTFHPRIRYPEVQTQTTPGEPTAEASSASPDSPGAPAAPARSGTHALSDASPAAAETAPEDAVVASPVPDAPAGASTGNTPR